MQNTEKLDQCNAMIDFLSSKGGQLFVNEQEDRLAQIIVNRNSQFERIKTNNDYVAFEKDFFRFSDQIKANQALLGEIASLDFWLQEKNRIVQLLQKESESPNL